MNTAKIVVVGSYNTDLVMNVERLPQSGETLIGHNFREAPGGKGSNQAVQAARLGATVAFIGCLGKDARGDAAQDLCKREQINTLYMHRHESLPTGLAFIIVDSTGANLITVDGGSNMGLDQAMLDSSTAAFDDAGAAISQFEVAPAIAIRSLQEAKARGAKTVLNPAPAYNLHGYDLSGIDYITPNESEARVCLGLQPDDPITLEELAEQLLALGVGAVLFTLGAAGARLIAPDRDLQQRAYKINVLDTVGAGDAFNAGFTVALAGGHTEAEAMRIGCATGSLSTTRPDTIASYHSLAEVQALIKEQG